MRSSLKVTLPLMAATLMLVGWSITSVVAQDATKGGIKGTVKGADGTPAASIPLSLFKGKVEMPAFGGRGRRGGGGADGAPPATAPALPTPLATTTADDKGAYKFDGLDAGDYTVMAGAIGGGGRRGGGGGAGGPPPGGAAPGGGRGGRGMGRGIGNVTVKAGDSATLDINLMAGRGRRGGGGGGGGGGGAPPGQGA